MKNWLSFTVSATLLASSLGCSSICPWSRNTSSYAACAPVTTCGPVVDSCGGVPTTVTGVPMMQGAPTTLVPSPQVYTPSP